MEETNQQNQATRHTNPVFKVAGRFCTDEVTKFSVSKLIPISIDCQKQDITLQKESFDLKAK